jgi:hypothetical protein
MAMMARKQAPQQPSTPTDADRVLAVRDELNRAAARDEPVANLKIRVPESLRKKIEIAAKAEGRSMNSEMLRRLDQSFLSPPLEDALQAKEALSSVQIGIWGGHLRLEVLAQTIELLSKSAPQALRDALTTATLNVLKARHEEKK